MKIITYQEVEDFIKNTPLEFQPSQTKISFPKITRIHRRLQQGHEFSEIKVVNNTLSDGHHRFVCLSLLNRPVKTIPAGENISKRELIEWKQVELEKSDYDQAHERRKYELKYDKHLLNNDL